MLDRRELELLSRKPAGLQQLVVTGAVTLLAAAAFAIFLDSRLPHKSTAPACDASAQSCAESVESAGRQPAKGAIAPAMR
ncbi:MAG: hypothetical protein ACXWKA_20115 [Xanthobacteraceae bacterium]